jgi:hypothetical protein
VRAGFPLTTRELVRAYDWLTSSNDGSPSAVGAEYYIVPDKIEAAIEMQRTSEDFSRMAIDLLLKRRSPGRVCLRYSGRGTERILALWAAKIFIHFADRPDCTGAVAEILEAFSGQHHTLQARDLALLVNLWVRHHKPRSVKAGPARSMLDALTERCTQGFFDVNEEVVTHLPELLASGLTLDTTAGIKREVY